MKYTIIEDGSPYFVRFTFDGLSKVVHFAKKYENRAVEFDKIEGFNFGGFTYHDYDAKIAKAIVLMLPMRHDIPLHEEKVSIFDTPPGGGNGVHKDSLWTLSRFNIVLDASDDLCETTWYSDEQFPGEPIGLPHLQNVFPDYHRLDEFVPVKKLIAKENEVILFNPTIYHAWQNIKSPHRRRILTFRTAESTSFEDVKQKLFKGLI